MASIGYMISLLRIISIVKHFMGLGGGLNPVHACGEHRRSILPSEDAGDDPVGGIKRQ